MSPTRGLSCLFFFGVCLTHAGVLRAQEVAQELQLQRKLLVNAGAGFGSALAVSGDVLVASAPDTSVQGEPAAAYVFLRDQAFGTWVENKRLVPEVGTQFDSFGYALAIEGDTLAAYSGAT